MTLKANGAAAVRREQMHDRRGAAPAWLGFISGALCAIIWGVQAAVSRQSVADGLTTGDVAILRFATAGLLLLPIALRTCRPFPFGPLGWRRAAVLSILAGTPYSLVLVGGVAFAPALHSSVITPGLIPLVAAGLAYFFLNEQLATANLVGLALVTVGVGVFSWEALADAPTREGAWRGDLLFVLAAVMWGLFTLLAKRWGADAVSATATICVLSLLTLPLWAGLLPLRLVAARPSALVLQALYQGVLVGVVALFLYASTVRFLGAVRAALFLPLVPVITALTAAALLGEIPSISEVLGMLIVMAGMALALRPGATSAQSGR
jgi:drug/metabolite transporter (DMT)-like permease